MTNPVPRPHLVGGPEHREIHIDDYDPSWPTRFDEHRVRLTASLGSRALRVEHVGSTSVPGLAAKPVIDIQLSVDDVSATADYEPHLLDAGYQLRVVEPGHRMYRTPDRDVHVHLWADSADERRHLLFRDRLRASPDDRERYEELKRTLAHRDWPDVNDYAQAKGPLIAEIVRNAETWAAEVGWNPSGDDGTGALDDGGE